MVVRQAMPFRTRNASASQNDANRDCFFEVQAKLALDTYVKLMSWRFVLNVELGLIEKDAREVPAPPLKKGAR